MSAITVEKWNKAFADLRVRVQDKNRKRQTINKLLKLVKLKVVYRFQNPCNEITLGELHTFITPKVNAK